MIVSREAPAVYYDCDHTLVRPYIKSFSYGQISRPETVKILDSTFEVNKDMVNEIKLSHARNHIVVIWSQGGSKWAEIVVKSLGIDEYVDFCMAKPSWWADDLTDPNLILEPSRRFYRDF